ncbi:MAG: class I SAM-dependent methyltransferase [Candidatus Heimdallarchaeota archaeon]|nr:class I SAM-dependent methyltransferase [Candidatus Heimdallarchaeota archaeon]
MKSNPSKDYDRMGEAYVRKNERDIHNALYNRPNIIALMDAIENKHVLEIGCGGGSFTEWLLNQKASVVACDISQKMVEIAKQRVGSKAEILLVDISKPLTFAEDKFFDVIVASLVLHYIDNWLPVFKEFQRILKDDGSIVISIHHPHADWLWHKRTNYFIKELYEDTWQIEGEPYKVTYYHRTLANIFAIFKKNGFYVDVLLEPFPVPEAKELDPVLYENLITKPRFLFFRLRKLS